MTHTERKQNQTSFKNYPNATLPININNGIFLDAKKARNFGNKLVDDYCQAQPYPHIVIDNFLPNAFIDEIINNFPIQKLQDDKLHESGYSGLHKRQIFPESCNNYIRNVFSFFNSSPFLQFLEGLTTIDSLIGDPYFTGGGFHEISRGGKLGVHADFRINEQLHLNRRINILIYLNKNWKDAYGGFLEMWDKSIKNKVESIAPIFNRCVIFNTGADSYHGHPEPLNTPDNITRKSIALYYYTSSKRVYEDTPAHSTMYFARPSDNIDVKKQAIKLRGDNYLKDWLPPVFFRKIRSLIDYISKR